MVEIKIGARQGACFTFGKKGNKMNVKGLRTKTEALKHEEYLAQASNVPKEYSDLVRNAITAAYKKEPLCHS